VSFLSLGNAALQRDLLRDYSARLSLIRETRRRAQATGPLVRLDAAEPAGERGPRRIPPRIDLLSEFDDAPGAE
jgi:hypothetical protein